MTTYDVEKVLEIVWGAGKGICSMYHSGDVSTQIKQDHSLLTDADLFAHRYICDALTIQFGLPVISEEAEVSHGERSKWEKFWLVDPLDGTQEFISRTDEFTINVALIDDKKPVMGVIYAPILGETYYAVEGLGAYEVKGSYHRLLCGGARPNIALTSRFSHTSQVTALAGINGITEVQTVGAALKFGRLARGDAKIYPRYGGSKEWDVAAGHILVKEAGGAVIGLENMKEISYNKPTMKNGPFIAVGDLAMLSEMRFLESDGSYLKP